MRYYFMHYYHLCLQLPVPCRLTHLPMTSSPAIIGTAFDSRGSNRRNSIRSIGEIVRVRLWWKSPTRYASNPCWHQVRSWETHSIGSNIRLQLWRLTSISLYFPSPSLFQSNRITRLIQFTLHGARACIFQLELCAPCASSEKKEEQHNKSELLAAVLKFPTIAIPHWNRLPVPSNIFPSFRSLLFVLFSPYLLLLLLLFLARSRRLAPQICAASIIRLHRICVILWCKTTASNTRIFGRWRIISFVWDGYVHYPETCQTNVHLPTSTARAGRSIFCTVNSSRDILCARNDDDGDGGGHGDDVCDELSWQPATGHETNLAKLQCK